MEENQIALIPLCIFVEDFNNSGVNQNFPIPPPTHIPCERCGAPRAEEVVRTLADLERLRTEASSLRDERLRQIAARKAQIISTRRLVKLDQPYIHRETPSGALGVIQ